MTNEKKYHAGVNPKTGKMVQNVELDVEVQARLGVFYLVTVAVLRVLAGIIFPTKVEGRQNIPKSGGVIFAFTHIGPLDGAMSNCTCRRRAYSFAKIELFKTPLQRFLLKHLGYIPVDRDKRNSKALGQAENILKNGGAMIIFPEGTYNKTEKILPLKFGAVSLAVKTGVPIVPVVITGKYRPFRRSARVEYLPKITVSGDLKKANEELRSKLQDVRTLHIEATKQRFRQSDGIGQAFLKPFLLGFLKFVYRPNIIGRENIPKNGAVIIASNHKHHFDPVLIMAGRPRRRVHYIAKKEHSEQVYGRIMNSFGVMFVDRQARDKNLLKATSIKFLNKKRILAIFPEGTRNTTTKLLLPFKFGAVSFAQKTGAALVPAAIIGWYRPFKSRLTVVFGKPIKVSPKDDLEKVNDKLYRSIKKMLIENGEKAHREEIYKYYKERKAK